MLHTIKPFTSRKSLRAHITALDIANRAMEILNDNLRQSSLRHKAFMEVNNNDDAEQAHLEALARIAAING